MVAGLHAALDLPGRLELHTFGHIITPMRRRMDKSGLVFVGLLLVLIAIVLSIAFFETSQQIPAVPTGQGSLLPPGTTPGQ
ncbi:hypothetical protein [Agrobacterium sp. NPDC090273]|uniref:hypothetical protein n=1 Tax=Agrobacterium sp. NPDC090273 TaxID=3363919 RepID=UPI00383A3697